MKYSDALEIKRNSEYLIGKNYRGAIISEIIIFPVEATKLESFKLEYYETLNAEKALEPFIDEQLDVVAILAKELIEENNILLYVKLENIKEEDFLNN